MSTVDDLAAAIGRLPVAERLRLIEIVARGAADDTPRRTAAAPKASPPSFLGLFEDEPDLMDEICRLAYEARASAQPRWIDR